VIPLSLKTCRVLGQNYDLGYLCVLQSSSKRDINTNGGGQNKGGSMSGNYGGNNNGGSGHGDNNNGGSGHGNDNDNQGGYNNGGHGNDNQGGYNNGGHGNDNQGGYNNGEHGNDNNGSNNNGGHGNDNNGGYNNGGHGNDNNGSNNNGGHGNDNDNHGGNNNGGHGNDNHGDDNDGGHGNDNHGGNNNGGHGNGNHGNGGTPNPTPVSVPCLGTFLPVCCCIEDLDCDATTFCLYTSGGPTNSGTCVPLGQLGDTCEENQNTNYYHQCAPELDCIHTVAGMPGQCGTPSPPSGVCVDDTDCDSSSFCLYTSYGSSDSGTCVTLGQLGDTCEENQNTNYYHKCALDLECIHVTVGLPGVCSTPSPPSGVCVDDTDCDSSSFCLYTSYGPSDSGICVTLGQLGDTCEENQNTNYYHKCALDLECIHVTVGLPGVCSTPSPPSGVCVHDTDCDSSCFCLYTSYGPSDSGTCVTLGQLGDTGEENQNTNYYHKCALDLECIHVTVGLPGVCSTPPSGACVDDMDCDDSTFCLYSSYGPSDSGTCVALGVLGDSCEENQNTNYYHKCALDLECIHVTVGLPGVCSTPPSGACQEDSDCDASTYCLYTSYGSSNSGTCVAFGVLGDTCEENQNTHCYHKCAVGLECLHLLSGMAGRCSNPSPYGG